MRKTNSKTDVFIFAEAMLNLCLTLGIHFLTKHFLVASARTPFSSCFRINHEFLFFFHLKRRQLQIENLIKNGGLFVYLSYLINILDFRLVLFL